MVINCSDKNNLFSSQLQVEESQQEKLEAVLLCLQSEESKEYSNHTHMTQGPPHATMLTQLRILCMQTHSYSLGSPACRHTHTAQGPLQATTLI